MARRISVELIGDAASLERAFAHSGAAATAFAETSVKASSTVTEARIAASAKQISSLRADQEAFATASATYVKGSDEQIAASKLLIDTQRRLQVAMGETAVVTGRAGGSAGHAEREVGRFTRGALAGTGVIRGLGRSLAFASGGFLAFAGGATLIRNSVVGAENLEKAQQGLAVAIEHTGGNVAKLTPKYEATAKAAQQFGINQADALTGLERATVLTGNAAKAQRAYQEALVISKATGKDFNAVLTATSKGQEGVTTSLQRYGILIAKGTPGAKQYQQVFARFAGQARANTSASQRFNATLANSEEIIGTAVLPTVNKYLGELGDWLDKMNKSGRLQKDVNGVLHATGDVFHTLGDVIGVVDKVTGSFANTLKLLAAFKFASLIGGWIGSLRTLAVEWGLVRTAAIGAAAADTAAGAGAAAAGAAGAAGTGGGIVAAGRFAGKAAAIEAAAPFAPFLAIPAIASLASVQGPKDLKIVGYTSGGQPIALGSDGNYYAVGPRGYRQVSKAQASAWIKSFVGVRGAPVITKQLQNLPRTGNVVPGVLQVPGFQPPRLPRTAATGGPLFGGAQRIKPLTAFELKPLENLAAAQAALTRTTRDDVAAARQVVGRIRSLIDQGKLKGAGLIQALQAEASALSTIWSAEDAAAQKRAQAAQAAKQRIQAQIENSINPLKLEVALSRAEAFGKPILPRLLALLRAARKALASGDLNLTQQKEALDQITSLKQQIKDAKTSSTSTFVAPAKLQLALAKDQALGTDQTKDLLKLKKAILKFIATHKKNIQAEIDAYNQLAQVNQELGSSAQSALGLFKQASTRALTEGLGLTAAQRKALRARLSQLGPGRTVPGTGVGAAGYVIGKDDRPIVIHSKTYLDGREVARNTTKHQQKRKRRNPGQRRGPNAGMAGA